MSQSPPPYLRLQNGMYITQDATGDMGVFSADNTELIGLKADKSTITFLRATTNIVLKGSITQYNGISTAGLGLPAIYAASTSATLTAADTNRINYTPPATAGSYRLSGIVDMNTWTTPASFTVQATYKDAFAVARTETLAVQRGSTGAMAAAVTAVDRWYYSLPLFAIDNSATAITVSTTGTFTGSPSYIHAATLEQLA